MQAVAEGRDFCVAVPDIERAGFDQVKTSVEDDPPGSHLTRRLVNCGEQSRAAARTAHGGAHEHPGQLDRTWIEHAQTRASRRGIAVSPEQEYARGRGKIVARRPGETLFDLGRR